MWEFLKTIWRYWKKFADFILRTFFQIILFVFYFTIMLPFALLFNIGDSESFRPGWFDPAESEAEDLY